MEAEMMKSPEKADPQRTPKPDYIPGVASRFAKIVRAAMVKFDVPRPMAMIGAQFLDGFMDNADDGEIVRALHFLTEEALPYILYGDDGE